MAVSGDTIEVQHGSFSGNVAIDKSLTIVAPAAAAIQIAIPSSPATISVIRQSGSPALARRSKSSP